MNEMPRSGVHWSFWAIGVAALVWNLLGVVNFTVQLTATDLGSFPEW
jgi:hypothetical protein